VNTCQYPVNTRQDPVNTRQDPANIHQDPVNTCQDPVNTRQDPVNTRQDPVKPRRDPANSRQDLVNTQRDPYNTRRNPLNSRQESVNTRRENAQGPPGRARVLPTSDKLQVGEEMLGSQPRVRTTRRQRQLGRTLSSIRAHGKPGKRNTKGRNHKMLFLTLVMGFLSQVQAEYYFKFVSNVRGSDGEILAYSDTCTKTSSRMFRYTLEMNPNLTDENTLILRRQRKRCETTGGKDSLLVAMCDINTAEWDRDSQQLTFSKINGERKVIAVKNIDSSNTQTLQCAAEYLQQIKLHQSEDQDTRVADMIKVLQEVTESFFSSGAESVKSRSKSPAPGSSNSVTPSDHGIASNAPNGTKQCDQEAKKYNMYQSYEVCSSADDEDGQYRSQKRDSHPQPHARALEDKREQPPRGFEVVGDHSTISLSITFSGKWWKVDGGKTSRQYTLTKSDSGGSPFTLTRTRTSIISKLLGRKVEVIPIDSLQSWFDPDRLRSQKDLIKDIWCDYIYLNFQKSDGKIIQITEVEFTNDKEEKFQQLIDHVLQKSSKKVAKDTSKVKDTGNRSPVKHGSDSTISGIAQANYESVPSFRFKADKTYYTLTINPYTSHEKEALMLSNSKDSNMFVYIASLRWDGKTLVVVKQRGEELRLDNGINCAGFEEYNTKSVEQVRQYLHKNRSKTENHIINAMNVLEDLLRDQRRVKNVQARVYGPTDPIKTRGMVQARTKA